MDSSEDLWVSGKNGYDFLQVSYWLEHCVLEDCSKLVLDACEEDSDV